MTPRSREKRTKISKWNIVKQEYDIPDIYNYDETLVVQCFKKLFAKEFAQAIPIRNHKIIDDLLFKWDKLQQKLDKCRKIKKSTNKAPTMKSFKFKYSIFNI